jgi:hypothetical protein
MLTSPPWRSRGTTPNIEKFCVEIGINLFVTGDHVLPGFIPGYDEEEDDR